MIFCVLQILHPILQIFLRCSIQEFAFLPVHIRISSFQVFAGFLDAATARGGEGDDGLALERLEQREPSCLHEWPSRDKRRRSQVVSLHEGVTIGSRRAL